MRLAVQARHRQRFAVWRLDRMRSPTSTAETAELIAFLGLSGIERAEAASLSYGGQRLLDMGARARDPPAHPAAR